MAAEIQSGHAKATANVKASHSIDNKLKAAWHDIKHVAAAPGRDAFLGLVDVNTFGWATKLKAALATHDSEIHDFWTNTLGGNYSILVKSITTGAKKKPLLGLDIMKGIQGPELLAAAAPIIAAMLAFLKKLGVNTDGLEKGADAAAAAFSAATGEPLPDILNAGITDMGMGADHKHLSAGFDIDATGWASPTVRKIATFGAIGLGAWVGWEWILKPMFKKK